LSDIGFRVNYVTFDQSHISRTPYPPTGENAVTGAQNSVPSTLMPPKKASALQIEIWSTRNQWRWGGPLKEKCLYITATLAPFESKVFTRYNCCWGPLWKQGRLLYTQQLLLGAPLKAQ